MLKLKTTSVEIPKAHQGDGIIFFRMPFPYTTINNGSVCRKKFITVIIVRKSECVTHCAETSWPGAS